MFKLQQQNSVVPTKWHDISMYNDEIVAKAEYLIKIKDAENIRYGHKFRLVRLEVMMEN